MSIITRRNVFPSEFLRKLSTYLSFNDWCQCTLVCRFWNHTFQRIIYKRFYVHTENQFEELINSLSIFHIGILIKEIYIRGSSFQKSLAYPNNFNKISTNNTFMITQRHFELIGKLCPHLEVINFDITQWEHINLENTTAAWKNMRSCSPINFSQFNKNFLSVFGMNLTELYIHHYAQDQDTLIERLGLLAATLQDLTLEIVMNDDEDTIQTSSYLKKISITLPQLRSLNLIKNKTPEYEITAQDNYILTSFIAPSHLETLSLHGYIDSIQWFEFISQNYPFLKELKLTKMSTSRFGTKWMWQHALIDLMQSLPMLKSLTLGGKSIPQLFCKGFAMELKRPDCPIQNLFINFETYHEIESCQFLSMVVSHGIRQLRYLRLRVWEQIPGWSNATSNLFKCKNLVHLELCLSKGMVSQFPFTPFLIDNFLKNLPQLEKLILTGANVQVTYNNYIDLDFDLIFALQSLELNQSKMENHAVLLRYLSTCCPKLNQIIFRKCELEKTQYSPLPSLNACEIDLRHSTLDELVLSSLMIYVGTVRSNEFIGIRIKCDNLDKMIWCSAIKPLETNVYPHYVLDDEVEKYTELDEVYQSYISSSGLATMPCNYSPIIGVFTIKCRSVKKVYLDNLKLRKIY